MKLSEMGCRKAMITNEETSLLASWSRERVTKSCVKECGREELET